MSKILQSTKTHPNTLLLGITAPYNHNLDSKAYLEEFESLVKSCEIVYEDFIKINLRSIDSSTFLTKGKLQEIQDLCTKLNIEQVVISEAITAQQERNLTHVLRADIIDRTRLILEIFNNNAITTEGRIQVEVAYYQYLKSRLTGKGIHLAQQSGVKGAGGKGSGETSKEMESRYLEDHIVKLKRKLAQIHITRETQRKRRLKNQEKLICLIGYTNAGKSTILNNLTNSDILAEDKLFATLDTTTRELYINHEKVGLLSDTVGFIQNLPHKLIDAFKATLSELTYADLLLLVVDISDTNWQLHIDVVFNILKELKVADKKVLYVFNKVDKIDLSKNKQLKQDLEKYTPQVLISADNKTGIKDLANKLYNWEY